MSDSGESASSDPHPAPRVRVAFESHGCRLNQAEGEGMLRILRESGFDYVEDPREADLLVLNTCTITHQADADARARIRRQQRLAPESQTIVTGCYANAASEEVAELPGVVGVIGNAEKHLIAELASRLAKPGSVGGAGAPGPGSPGPRVQVQPLVQLRTSGSGWRARQRPVLQVPVGTGHTRARAQLKIQDGCNYRCAFCIVPQVRGRNRSTPIDQLVTGLREFAAENRPEVVLTGVHIGTYGWDYQQRDGLVRLIDALSAELHRLGADTWLRLGSLDPHELSRPLIDRLAADQTRVCPHLHLPVQSGSDVVLSSMRRAHRADALAAAVSEARAAVPDLAIGSDLIAGFPGERASDFEATADLLRDGLLDYAHVFPYSPRRGTEAAELSPQIDAGTKQTRVQTLRELSDQNWLRFRGAQLGRIRRAVVMKKPDRNGQFHALTDNYIKVRLGSELPPELLGRAVEVELTEVHGSLTLAELRSRPRT